MQVSVTERGTFKRCSLQWDYTSMNRRRLTPIVPKATFELGTLIHKALEQWALDPTADLEELFKVQAGIGISIVKQRYLQQVGAPISQIELGDYYDLFELGSKMCRNYQDYWKSPIDSAS